MVKSRKTSLTVVVLLAACAAVFTLALTINTINKNDAIRLKGYEDAAIPVGVAKAKEECQKEGLKAEVCDSITGSATTSECGGMTCWIVYTRSDVPHSYGAGVTINKQNGQYVIIDYLRNPGA